MIVLTDGKSRDNAVDAAGRIKALNVEIFVAGIGPKVDQEELEQMASFQEWVFTVENYQALLKASLTTEVCAPPFVCAYEVAVCDEAGQSCQVNCDEELGYYHDNRDCRGYCYCSGNEVPSRYE